MYPSSAQTSTSLQHVPVDLDLERELPTHLKSRLAFATQKLKELVAVAAEVAARDAPSPSPTPPALDLATHTGAPAQDIASATQPGPPKTYFCRSEPYEMRRPKQLRFPPFPTTTIGSFPQTPTIRRARLQYTRGILTEAQYRECMAAEIGHAVGVQDALELDGQCTAACGQCIACTSSRFTYLVALQFWSTARLSAQICANTLASGWQAFS